ncbi:MurR/RpiR family transcriptional regulator [Shouchella shacheensis]|uniref:MurR/RpiR family transcriptional regulator n=1 Tax=Shouchella shacheensis TaxID=1649580 RepID=UPI00073FF139|nr:MurR/RpiR family transcriptional regulator [Shouchella shacheensis]
MLLFEERVKQFEYKLNETDEAVVEYVREHKVAVVKKSIQALATELFTVPNTITRVSKKLGYDGYSQLKNSLKVELDEAESERKTGLALHIAKTFDLLDDAKVELVTKKLCEARRVLCYGVGDTAPFCEMFASNLKKVGLDARFHMHRHEMIAEIEAMKKTDILFILSFSGETSQILEIASLAKQKGLPLISLTHFSQNALQRVADVNLYCYAPEMRLNGYNVTDRTTAMVVLRTVSESCWTYTGYVYKYT